MYKSITVVNINTSLSVSNRTGRQKKKISKDVTEQVNKLDLINIYTMYLTSAELLLFSNTHRNIYKNCPCAEP